MSRRHSPTGGTGFPAVLYFSVALNLALAGTAVRLWRSSPPPVAPAAAHFVAATTMDRSPAVELPPAETFATNRFHWRQVESTDYEEYVANLRSIGCPEKTLRDIIVADVGRLYAQHRHDLKINLPFWTGGKKLKAAELAVAAQTEALEKEQATLIQHLLGIEWFGERGKIRPDHLEEQALARFLLGPLPEEKFQSVIRLFQKYEQLESAVNRRAGDILTDADEEEHRELMREMRQELRAALSPAELEEMNARAGCMALFKDDFQKYVELTPAEARQLSLACFGDGGGFGLFEPSRHESPEQGEAREQQFTNTVAQLLGPGRFAEFERAQDYNYRRLLDLAQENNLPKATARQVYDARQLAAEEVAQLRDDASLDETARRQKFEQMQGELQKAASEILGTGGFQKYLENGGAWITNVTSL